MTWFEKIKACGTPYDMAHILDWDGMSFCPRDENYGKCRYDKCHAGFFSYCIICIENWLKEEAENDDDV